MALEADDSCPTCGSKLEALRRPQLRQCNVCRRKVPVAFLYCGYCAAPMENTELRARVAQVAAPEGGWPSLSGELLQVKFYLQQGELDEAYDLLTILQQRYPGHPDLADFVRSSPMKADPQVESLVEEVLASSAKLTDKIARRQAPKWTAPRANGSRGPTMAHEVVPDHDAAEADDAAVTSPRLERKAVLGDDEITARRQEAITRPEPTVAEATRQAEQRAKSMTVVGEKVSGEISTGRSGGKAKAKAKPIQRTRVYRTVDPVTARPTTKTKTVVVDTLQPPAPWTPDEGAPVEAKTDGRPVEEITPEDRKPEESAQPAEPAASGETKKRSRKRSNDTARKRKLAASKPSKRKRESERPMGTSFGAGVLSRFGR